MREIKLKAKIKENGDFELSNLTDNKSFMVEYSSKKLSAKTLYETINYSVDVNYIFDEDEIEASDQRMNEYFQEVRSLIMEIITSINELNFQTEDSTSIDKMIEDNSLENDWWVLHS